MVSCVRRDPCSASHFVNFSKMRANGGFCSPSLRENGFTIHTTALAITGRSPGPSSSSPPSPLPPSVEEGSGSMSSFVPWGRRRVEKKSG